MKELFPSQGFKSTRWGSWAAAGAELDARLDATFAPRLHQYAWINHFIIIIYRVGKHVKVGAVVCSCAATPGWCSQNTEKSMFYIAQNVPAVFSLLLPSFITSEIIWNRKEVDTMKWVAMGGNDTFLPCFCSDSTCCNVLMKYPLLSPPPHTHFLLLIAAMPQTRLVRMHETVKSLPFALLCLPNDATCPRVLASLVREFSGFSVPVLSCWCSFPPFQSLDGRRSYWPKSVSVKAKTCGSQGPQGPGTKGPFYRTVERSRGRVAPNNWLWVSL